MSQRMGRNGKAGRQSQFYNSATQIPPSEKRSAEGRPRTDIMNVHIKTIHEILDALEAEFPIDKNREYVTGLSMGGECTWMSMIMRHDRFAAAAPIC